MVATSDVRRRTDDEPGTTGKPGESQTTGAQLLVVWACSTGARVGPAIPANANETRNSRIAACAIFRSNRNGPGDLYLKDLTRTDPEELLLRTPFRKEPTDWSPDGQYLLFDNY